MFANFHTTSALIGAAALVLMLIVLDPWQMWLQRKDEPGASPVDPWAYQSELMRISGQHQPLRPELNKGALMYSALIMEEAGETFAGLAAALRDEAAAHEHNQVQEVRRILADVAHTLRFRSLQARGLLEDCPEFTVPLGMAHAKEIFDGHEDIMVVNCGFGLACGLPGLEGYVEVVDSNLSKRNPATGMIDKTPDGKWIKGPAYRAPDLARVLREHCYSDAQLDALDIGKVIPLKGAV